MVSILRRPILFVLVMASGLLLKPEVQAQVEFRKPTWRDLRPQGNSQQELLNRSTDQTEQQFQFASKSKEQAPKPIVTRQTTFGVPFSINPDVGPIREVQLHVSRNKGVSWSLYSKQLPTAREFPFQANADGEYWFAVKTVGTKIPESKLAPELIIAIDSVKPNVTATLKTDALGRLVVSWRAVDENLDPDSVRITYQPVANWGRQGLGWKEVRLPKPDANIDKVYEDEIAFLPDTNNVTIDLRLAIADKAGNVGIVNRRYNLPRIASQMQRNLKPGIAERIQSATSVAQSGSGDRPPSTDPFASVTQAEKDAAATQVGLDSGFAKEATQGSSSVASSSQREQGWHIQGGSGFGQNFYENSPHENELTGSGDSIPHSINDPGFQNPHRLASSGRTTNDAQEGYDRGSNLNRIPSGQYAKLSNSKKFELDYHVEHIQPDDISRLEIWVTEDAGQTWKLHSVDQDRQSPVQLDVEQDGVYGYRIRIQTVDGLESAQPVKGDSADVWVEVDTTKPSVELTSVPYGRRADAGKLIINWRAADRRMASKPVTLYYSVNLDGPWNIIVEKLRNTGQFKWPVTDRIPRNVYIRIETIDAAGNRNFHQTDQPIDLSGLNPRGMIRSVRPIK